MKCRYNPHAYCAVVDAKTFLAGFCTGIALATFLAIAILNNWFSGAK